MSVLDIADRFNAEQFTQYAGNEPYGVDSDSESAARRAAMNQFLDSDQQWPQIEYPRFERLELEQTERAYQTMLRQLWDDDSPEGEAQFELIARKLAELYRVLEVRRRMGRTTVIDLNSLSSERAGEMSREIYTTPDPEDFAVMLGNEQNIAYRHLDSQYARDALGLTGPVKSERAMSEYMLSDEALARAREDIFAIFPALNDVLVPADDKKYTPQESIEVMQRWLDALGMSGWKAVASEGTAMEASIAREQIEVGINRAAPLSATKLNELGIHEVLGHAWTGFAAKQQTDPAQSSDTLSHMLIDEVRAVILEQVLTGKKRIPGKQYLLSQGLQLGMDRGGKRRSFRDTYDILWRLEALHSVDAGTEVNERAAQVGAYGQVLRTTRGGAYDARDIIYFSRVRVATRWFESVSRIEDDSLRREVLRWSLSARFDPTVVADVERFSKDAPEDFRALVVNLAEQSSGDLAEHGQTSEAMVS